MRSLQRARWIILAASYWCASTWADELLHRYEGNVLIHDPSTGWGIADACDGACSESLEDGAFVLRWDSSGADHLTNYFHRLAPTVEEVPPPPFWVEWRFLSSVHRTGFCCCCDARFRVHYLEMLEEVQIFGDAATSQSGDDVITGLELNAYHTYRYETPNGSDFCFAVDGKVFTCASEHHTLLGRTLQTGSDGTVSGVNKWDYIRYGRISQGEAIVVSDPPGGILDADAYPALNRFTVTFDAPNYVYIDDVTVSTTSGPLPVVTKTRRLDNGGPETVEIVLNRPLTVGATTRFTFATGGTPNTVEYQLVSMGACCLSDGTCQVTHAADCTDQGGMFSQDADCTSARGCCVPGGSCRTLDPVCCALAGGAPATPDILCDSDTDGDGVDAACGDGCPNDPLKTAGGLCGCGTPDTDSDSDTTPDCRDACPGMDDLRDEDGNEIADCLEVLPIIPTLSSWGAVILTLSLLIAAKISFPRDRTVS